MLHPLIKLLCLLALSGYLSLAQAGQPALADDGREVILNKDGSWTFKSDDRFATTPEGRRVRLGADGSWQYTGDTTVAPVQLAGDRQFVAASELQVAVEQLRIETYRDNRGKNTRKKTQSVFVLQLALDQSAEQPLTLNAVPGWFRVEDTDGREYPVIRVTPETIALNPGEKLEVAVRADGAPHWWTTKSMMLIIDESLFDSDEPLELVTAMSAARKVDVDSLPE